MTILHGTARLFAAFLLVISCCPLADASDDADEAPPTQQPLVETVTVTATRLPGGEEPIDRVPAHVTVLTREDIRRSGARTLQELLEREAGAIVHDQVGNGVETTFDLRGFRQGNGTRVFLDGVPLNDPRNNALALELVPIDALERVEITRGPAAALAGGGAEAGVVHLLTRHGDIRGIELSVAAGTDRARRYAGEARGRAGAFDLLLAGARDQSDGFRDHGGGELTRWAGTAGVRAGGPDGRLELTLVHAEKDLGAPGALTREEWREDPFQSRHNTLDRDRGDSTQAGLGWRGAVTDRLSLATNLFAREGGAEILTTGRAAPVFGGFFLDTDERSHGSTVQMSHRVRSGPREHVLTAGLEWQGARVDSLGDVTPTEDPGRVDRVAPDSQNVTERRTLALFVQEAWQLGPSWSLQMGARMDRDRIAYRETRPVASNRSGRSFSEVSLRAGAVWSPASRASCYVSYGEGFLAPTAEQLFAFPGFGSNPDLRPEDATSYEIGVRLRGKEVQGSAALFRVETEDSIVFDPDSSLGLFGANVNRGKARRLGLESSLRGRIRPGVTVFAGAAWTEGVSKSGPSQGRRLPMVPRQRVTAGLELDLPRSVLLRADTTYVGDQVLDNDDAGAQSPLPAYTVVNARAAWSPPSRRRAPNLFLEVRNLLDRRYATRGIYAFDFASAESAVFVTPAPSRRYLLGAGWIF